MFPLTTDLLDGTHDEVLAELARVREQRNLLSMEVVRLRAEIDALRMVYNPE